ncbi:MAG: hypothetical protein COW63_18985 [Bacteroidetes bacterium CG18_big_fil_WC_8_21_14_2_50_41_14]|nr:MAG: hypothetical protein COW63_18985 [Bacteroidetes bacterium CG18_big_fil_WC_8_21_14_2_50_41_14]PJB57511.1 MAG: hypothetical protein CO098_11285 [Bacteroidetes bacterium CG_4_9_14_3_um_filter_41_19]
MSDYQLLKKLLPYLEKFESEQKGNNLMDFSNYLKKELLSVSPVSTNMPDFSMAEHHLPERFPEVEFSTMLTELYRFGRHYVKKALVTTGIKTLEEFGLLASLIKTPGLLKSELINLQLMEISSGTEVLRRLILSELILEYADVNDKRSKRLELTSKGRETIIAAFYEMYKAARIIRGNLSDEELVQATQVMEKLSAFHWHIHQSDKTSDINLLLDRYINN